MRQALEASHNDTETTPFLSSQQHAPNNYGEGGGESVDAPHSYSAGTEDEDYMWQEEEEEDEDDDESQEEDTAQRSAVQRTCAAIKNAFVIIANVESKRILCLDESEYYPPCRVHLTVLTLCFLTPPHRLVGLPSRTQSSRPRRRTSLFHASQMDRLGMVCRVGRVVCGGTIHL